MHILYRIHAGFGHSSTIFNLPFPYILEILSSIFLWFIFWQREIALRNWDWANLLLWNESKNAISRFLWSLQTSTKNKYQDVVVVVVKHCNMDPFLESMIIAASRKSFLNVFRSQQLWQFGWCLGMGNAAFDAIF